MTSKIFLVCGPSGAGKSWVCNQLRGKFDYIEHDTYPTDEYAYALSDASNQEGKPILGDCPFRTSHLVNQLRELGHQVEAIYIVEPREVVAKRIIQRDGVAGLTPRRWKQYEHLQERAEAFGDFVGTAQEVLSHLQSK